MVRPKRASKDPAPAIELDRWNRDASASKSDRRHGTFQKSWM
jgi:hypothetical protein